jgi:hypothetical protein
LRQALPSVKRRRVAVFCPNGGQHLHNSNADVDPLLSIKFRRPHLPASRLVARPAAAYFREMPLHLRAVDDSDDDTLDNYVVMTGGYCVGAYNRLPRGPSEHGPSQGDWIWGVGFGHPIDDGGMAGTADEAENAIVVSFRKQLARIGLAEVEGSRLRPLMRKPTPPAHWDIPRCERDFDREHTRVLDGPRIARITSGDLTVGLLREVAIAPRAGHARRHWTTHWTWAISGTRHNPPNFVWHGCGSSLEESQDALMRAWSTWIAWAGLRQMRALEMSRPIRLLC